MTYAALASAALLLVTGAVQAADPASPVGLWRTFSDKTGQETGRVEIFARDGELYGRVTAILDPAKAAATCQNCDGDRRGQRVLGLEIMRGLKPDGARWDGGTLLDPETGSVYHCILRLSDGGQRLEVRGFVGIALMGRSQTWLRAS